MNDLDLWQKIQNGDESAFKSLFYHYHPTLVNLAYSYINDEATAKDLAQDVFVQIWQKRKDLHIRENLRGYLIRAVRNQCINHLKKKKAISLNELEPATDPDPDGQERLHLQDLRKKVQLAISHMPEACRAVYLLRRMEGLSLKEIARELNISTKTVENQLTKAHKILINFIRPVLAALYILLRLM